LVCIVKAAARRYEYGAGRSSRGTAVKTERKREQNAERTERRETKLRFEAPLLQESRRNSKKKRKNWKAAELDEKPPLRRLNHKEKAGKLKQDQKIVFQRQLILCRILKLPKISDTVLRREST